MRETPERIAIVEKAKKSNDVEVVEDDKIPF